MTVRTALVVCVALVPALVLAQGMGGAATDRLDWPGSPTDRYLDAEEVRSVLHGGTEAFFTCFRKHARAGVDASDVGVGFTIERDGRAAAVEPELGNAPAELGTCLTDAVQDLEFGEHDGDPLEVSYPIVYQVDRKGARVLPYPVVFTKPRPIRMPLLQLPADIDPGELRMLELILVHDAPAPEPEPASE